MSTAQKVTVLEKEISVLKSQISLLTAKFEMIREAPQGTHKSIKNDTENTNNVPISPAYSKNSVNKREKKYTCMVCTKPMSIKANVACDCTLHKKCLKVVVDGVKKVSENCPVCGVTVPQDLIDSINKNDLNVKRAQAIKKEKANKATDPTVDATDTLVLPETVHQSLPTKEIVFEKVSDTESDIDIDQFAKEIQEDFNDDLKF